MKHFLITFIFYATYTQILALNIENHNKKNNTLGYNTCNMMTNGEHDVIKHIIKPNMIVFDIGAHKGDWSQRVLDTHTSAKLFSFEPVLSNFISLEGRFKDQKYHIHCYNCALGKKIVTSQMFMYTGEEASTLGSFYHRPILDNNLHQKPYVIHVPTTTLDNFCTENNIGHIDYLKIDTEGAELDVLLGAQQLIALKCIDRIQFEYGGTYKDAKITLKDIYHLLQSNDFQIFRIVPNTLIHLSNWSDEYENFTYSNYLAIQTNILKELK